MTLVVTDRVQSVHADRRRMTGDVVGVDADRLCDRSRLGGRDDDDVGSPYVGCETMEGSSRLNSTPTGMTSRHVVDAEVCSLSSIPKEVLVQSRPQQPSQPSQIRRRRREAQCAKSDQRLKLHHSSPLTEDRNWKMNIDLYGHAEVQAIVTLYDKGCPNGCPTQNDHPRRCCATSLIRNAL